MILPTFHALNSLQSVKQLVVCMSDSRLLQTTLVCGLLRTMDVIILDGPMAFGYSN